jgi:hypothetical protein
MAGAQTCNVGAPLPQTHIKHINSRNYDNDKTVATIIKHAATLTNVLSFLNSTYTLFLIQQVKVK